MQLSDRGLKLIESFEGYAKAMPDGGCKAYREKLNGKFDKWTIAWGCTEGVIADTVLTREQAEAAFRRELQKHVDAVNRMVTVPLNQNEFDPLVSQSYNFGDEALQNSSIIRKLNKGDWRGAAAAMLLWDKFNGKPLKALISRRHAEAALFLEPVDGAEDDVAPQSPEPAPEPPSHATVGTAGALGGATLLGAAQNMPDLSALNSIQSTGSSLHGFLTWLTSSPLEVVCVVLVVLAVLVLPRLWRAM